jgi:amino acid permease
LVVRIEVIERNEWFFIILGIAVNCGGNTDHQYIGGKNWHKADAPFVDGVMAMDSVPPLFGC